MIRLPIEMKKRTMKRSLMVVILLFKNLERFPRIESPIMKAPVPGEYPKTAARTAKTNPRPSAKRKGISSYSSSKAPR